MNKRKMINKVELIESLEATVKFHNDALASTQVDYRYRLPTKDDLGKLLMYTLLEMKKKNKKVKKEKEEKPSTTTTTTTVKHPPPPLNFICLLELNEKNMVEEEEEEEELDTWGFLNNLKYRSLSHWSIPRPRSRVGDMGGCQVKLRVSKRVFIGRKVCTLMVIREKIDGGGGGLVPLMEPPLKGSVVITKESLQRLQTCIQEELGLSWRDEFPEMIRRDTRTPRDSKPIPLLRRVPTTSAEEEEEELSIPLQRNSSSPPLTISLKDNKAAADEGGEEEYNRVLNAYMHKAHKRLKMTTRYVDEDEEDEVFKKWVEEEQLRVKKEEEEEGEQQQQQQQC